MVQPPPRMLTCRDVKKRSERISAALWIPLVRCLLPSSENEFTDAVEADDLPPYGSRGIALLSDYDFDPLHFGLVD